MRPAENLRTTAGDWETAACANGFSAADAAGAGVTTGGAGACGGSCVAVCAERAKAPSERASRETEMVLRITNGPSIAVLARSRTRGVVPAAAGQRSPYLVGDA